MICHNPSTRPDHHLLCNPALLLDTPLQARILPQPWICRAPIDVVVPVLALGLEAVINPLLQRHVGRTLDELQR